MPQGYEDDIDPQQEPLSDEEIADLRKAKSKHVVMTTLKYGAVAAGAFGLLFAGAPVVFGGALVKSLPLWLTGPGAVASFTTQTGADMAGQAVAGLGKMALNAGTIGALMGGAGGAGLGLIRGLSTMEREEENYIEDKEYRTAQAKNRKLAAAKMAMLEKQQALKIAELERQHGLPPMSGRGQTGWEMG